MINALAQEIHAMNREKGWYDEDRSFPELLCLTHAELSEALEEYRNGNAPDQTYVSGGKPEGVPIELADVVIRVLDICARYGIDMEEAIRIKMEYNAKRSYRHGGKKL